MAMLTLASPLATGCGCPLAEQASIVGSTYTNSAYGITVEAPPEWRSATSCTSAGDASVMLTVVSPGGVYGSECRFELHLNNRRFTKPDEYIPPLPYSEDRGKFTLEYEQVKVGGVPMIEATSSFMTNVVPRPFAEPEKKRMSVGSWKFFHRNRGFQMITAGPAGSECTPKAARMARSIQLR